MSDGPASSLDPYKKAARRLKKAVAADDLDALARVAVHVDPAKALNRSYACKIRS